MTTPLKIIKKRLADLGIRPSKGLGQNFLISESVYRKIIEAAELERGETVLEVGPGLGTLTEYLTKAGAKVIAVEKDRKLIAFLKYLFTFGHRKSEDVTIVEGDVLKINPTKLGMIDNSYKVVANIPYYITSRLLRNIFELWPKPKLVVLLVQREVAQRIIAKPPHMNMLAIAVQYFSKPKIINKVSKGSFYPLPKVDSAIIKLVPRSEQWIVDSELQTTHYPVATHHFFKVVRTGFSSKRKKLANNLAAGFQLTKDATKKILISMAISPDSRPENLTIEQWQKLTTALLIEEKRS